VFHLEWLAGCVSSNTWADDLKLCYDSSSSTMGAEDGSGVAKEEHQPAAIENDQSKVKRLACTADNSH
jgi:hypothetical protein